MAIFQLGEFKLHSGETASWKVECEKLTLLDWMGIANIVWDKLPPFSEVVGVPRGGLLLADLLDNFKRKEGGLLIVDDVLTTGRSMEKMKERYQGGKEVTGFVVFARNKPPDWVKVMWRFGL